MSVRRFVYKTSAKVYNGAFYFYVLIICYIYLYLVNPFRLSYSSQRIRSTTERLN